MKDYYFILGVASKAHNSEIKEAFRKLCLKYHPDRTVTNSHNQERYMEICEAYRILSNKTKRANYDRKRAQPKDQGIKEGLYPELNKSYKGFFPWLAAFAIIIVGALALIFVINTDNPYEEPVSPIGENVLIASTPPPASAVAAPPVDTVAPPPVDTVLATPVDTTAPANPDSIRKRQELANRITAALSENTASVPPGSSDERNHEYSISGNKLLVKYNSGPRGRASYKQVSIPLQDVKSVYFYAGKLWITSSRKTIRVSDLNTGARSRTDFFQVPVNKASAAETEKQLSEAIANLKGM